MKIFLKLLLIFLASLCLFSKNTLGLHVNNETHFEKRPDALLKIHGGSVFFSSEKRNYDDPATTFYKKSGSIMDSIPLFENYYLTGVSRIYFNQHTLYLCGLVQFEPNDSVRIFVFQCDTNLIPLDTIIFKPYKKQVSSLMTGLSTEPFSAFYIAETAPGSIQKSIYSISFTSEGEILTHQQAPVLSNTIYFSGVSEIPTSGGFAVSGFYTQPGGFITPCAFLFNDSLTYQKIWIYPPTEIFGILQSGIQIYSNTTFISGELAYVTSRAYLADTVIVIPQNYQYYMKAMLADTAGHVYKVNAFGAGDTTLYPAFFKHQVATADNHFYIVWTKNIEVDCIPYCPYNSWIGITYLNDSLDVEWEQFFGGDDFYTSHIAEASPDGGIVVAGTRYQYNDPGQPHEVIIFSVSPEGVVTGTSGNQPLQGKQAIVYPNPGDGKLMVETGSHIKQAEFSLFDINGHLLLTSILSNKITEINTEQLPSGVYIFNIGNENFRESGKWIKQ